MAKYWKSGMVKTRLGTCIGMDQAAEIYKAFLFRLADRFSTCGDHRQLIVSPPEQFETMRMAMGNRWQTVLQSEGDLGERMRNWFASHWPGDTGNAKRRVILIGADCPTLDCRTLDEMFEKLEDHELALVPADDGGYVAIGLAGWSWTPSFDELFSDIPWSTAFVCQKTLAAAERLGLSVATLPSHGDIDTVDDLWQWQRRIESSSNDAQQLLSHVRRMIPPSPPSHEIAIVGGGVIGLSIAWECLRRGLRVAIIESGRVGRATSWAAAGILPPANFDRATDPIDQLRGFSHALWPGWASELSRASGIDCGLDRCGGWYLAGSPGEAAAMTGMVDYWSELGVECHQFDRERLLQSLPDVVAWADSNPWIQRHPESAAWFVPDEYQVRPPRLLAALRIACLELGAVLVEETTVTRLDSSSSGATALIDGHGRTILHAMQIVACGGVLTSTIEPRHNLSQSIIPVRGQVLLLHHESFRTRRVVNVGNRYLITRGDGLVLVGSCEEEVGLTPGTTDAIIEELRRFAVSLFPALADATERSRWSGHRPMTFDGFPMIGHLPGTSNVWIAAGHYRSGIHLAPGTAVAVADLIQCKSSFMSMDAFHFSAFS